MLQPVKPQPAVLAGTLLPAAVLLVCTRLTFVAAAHAAQHS